ncbi:hypothetical protein [Cupriavidus neocaledonicus]|nr:hypothetical protein [Cupriavidus neocaledonicus]
MELIPTTATAAEKLKRLAKTLRKTTGTSLAVALDAVAKRHGYEHWKHVTLCLEQAASLSLSKPLPDSLKDLLDRAAARNPASAESQKAFAQGFVFAMDIKDAEELSLTSEWGHANIRPKRYHKPRSYIETKNPAKFDIRAESLAGASTDSLRSGERRPDLPRAFHLVAVQVDRGGRDRRMP